MITGALTISSLIITSTTISFLANAFVIPEIFCGEKLQFSNGYEYPATYISLNIINGYKECLIRLRDDKFNYFTKLIKLKG